MSLSERLVRGLIAAAAFAVPWVFWPYVDQVFALPKLLALTIVTISGAVALAACAPTRERAWKAMLGRGRWALIMWTLAGISLLRAGIDSQGVLGETQQFQGLWSLSLYVMCWGFGYTCFDQTSDFRRLAVALAGGGAGVAGYALLQVAHLDPIWDSLLAGRATSTIGQPNALAAYLASVAPFAIVLARGSGEENSIRVSAGWALVAGLVALGMLSGGSRGGVLGAVIGTCCVSFVQPARRGRPAAAIQQLKRWVPPALLVGAASMLLLAVSTPTRESLLYTAGRGFGVRDSHSTESAEGHLELWEIGMRMAADHPLFGIGPERFPLEFPEYRDRYLGPDRRAAYLPFRVESPHNVYVSWAAGIGFPGAFAYLGVVGAGLVGARRAIQQAERGSTEAVLGIALFASLVTHVVSDAFMTAEVSSTWMFWLLLGIATRAGDLAMAS